MKRIVAIGLTSAVLLSLSACGGGPELGMPADAAPPKTLDMTDKFDKMKGAIPKKGSSGATGKPGVGKPGVGKF
jgi:predicted small lipoprotein YifL